MQNINDLYYIKDVIFTFLNYYENKYNCESFAIFKENKKLTKHNIIEKAYIFVFKKGGYIFRDPTHKDMIYFEIRFDFNFNNIFISYSPSLSPCVKRLKHKLDKKIFPINTDITYDIRPFYGYDDYFCCEFVKKIFEFCLKNKN